MKVHSFFILALIMGILFTEDSGWSNARNSSIGNRNDSNQGTQGYIPPCETSIEDGASTITFFNGTQSPLVEKTKTSSAEAKENKPNSQNQ